MAGHKKNFDTKPQELYNENIRLREELQGKSIDVEDGYQAFPTGFSRITRSVKKNRGCLSQCLAIIILIIVVILLLVFRYSSVMSQLVPKDGILFKSDPLTIGKVDRDDVEICQGNQLKRSFPDFDYATYGYHIMYGYPLATGHDPGLTHPIFKADYSSSKQTADCRYQVPRGYHLAPDVACVTSFSSETIKDSNQFSKHLSVSAEVGGGGWGVSFSASADYKKKTSVMSASESVFIFSKAECNYYFSKLNEQDPPPFSMDFINLAKNIKTKDDVFNFFDYYGTHYMTYTLFGARFIYEYKMSQKAFQQESSEEVSVSVKASYSGLFSLSGGFGMSSGQAQKAQNFLQKVETKTISIGAPPPSNGDTMTWASTVKETPIPVKMKLESIENLFSDRYMRNYQVDYNSIRQKIKDGKKSYCLNLKAKGVVDTCKMMSSYMTFNNLYISGGTKYTYNENQCIERCLEDSRCFTVHHFSSNICYIYRIGNKIASETGSSQKGSKVIIFHDNLVLLGKSFKISNVRIKQGIDSRKKINKHNETECLNECKKDAICSVFTFNNMVKENDTNCWLYSLEKISCEGSTEEKCNTLSVENDYTTWFYAGN